MIPEMWWENYPQPVAPMSADDLALYNAAA
jgi:hypothetical protein